MSKKEVYIQPNRPTPFHPVIFNEEKCTGCNSCIEVCQADVFLPNPVKGKPPIIVYPDECFYGGCCAGACPVPGAVKFNHPLTQRVRWKRKATGETFRVK